MKTKLNFSIFLIVAVLLFAGCGNTTTNPPISENDLISNPSFEINGSPSLQGWNWRFNTDTIAYPFSEDVPPNGGKYSLVLFAGWFPPSELITTIPAVTSKHIYEFSVWAKKMGLVGGGVIFSWKRPDTLITRKILSVTDTVWTNYLLKDTLNASVGDSIVLLLTGGGCDFCTGRTYFDLCKLTVR